MLTLLAPVVWLLAVALFPFAVARDVRAYYRGYKSMTAVLVARHARRRARYAGIITRITHRREVA